MNVKSTHDFDIDCYVSSLGRLCRDGIICNLSYGDKFDISSMFTDTEQRQVRFKRHQIEVLLSGEEQSDELWVLYFNGSIDSENTHTKYGQDITYKTEDAIEYVSSPNASDNGTQFEIELSMRRIEEGYLAVYNSLYNDEFADYEITYGAKESSSKCILYENENSVEYLVYDRESKNGKCGLYVCYLAIKETDGRWSYENATIENTYAYVYETGEVISSDKESWQDVGTKSYQNATGEY